jgi:ABC-type antimicrobial peptide transport system permease subunit
MHPPRPARFLFKVLVSRRDKAYLGDVQEIYLGLAERLGDGAADRWYWKEALKSLPRFITESIRWRLIMFKHYLKTAVRYVRRDKGYSFLNLAGLAIGMACFVLLLMWVQDEIHWDRFHKNSPSLYRLESTMVSQPAPLGPYLKANYPEIANAVRFYYSQPRMVKYEEKFFDEDGFALADPSVFDMFTIPFLAGDPTTVFVNPDSVVLTEDAAKKYFGNADAVGRVLIVENRFPVRVTGVVKTPPRNSDIQFDILGEFRILGHFQKGYENHWGNHEYPTYVQLAKGATAGALIPKIAHIVLDRLPISSTPLTMKPLSRIHLYEDGAIQYVAIFSLIGLFILAIAACNFINLTTARSGKRAKEIAIRKVVGAVRPQLVKQFLGESVLLSLGALLIALLVVALVLPSFNALTGKNFSLGFLLGYGLFLYLLGTAIAIGVISGAYPAFLLSSFRPAGLFKGSRQRTGRLSAGARFRKALVIAQFAISIGLMISTLYIQRQLSFIRGFDLGIQKENVVYLPVKEPILKSRESFVNELTSRPGIVNVSFASSLPSYVNNSASGAVWEGKDADFKPSWPFISTDDRYLDTLGIKVIKGSNFPTPEETIKAPRFIVNQKALEEMNIKDPIGARFSLWGVQGKIIGVIKNFHYRPLRESIQPLLLFIMPQAYRHILVRIQPENGNVDEILSRIKDVWDHFASGLPFSYEFLDAAYDRVYATERRMSSEFKYFTFLGIFISCLGLVGLAAFIAEQKRKEIGIRKVLGASLGGVLRQINKEFLAPILLSNLIAWPLAFWGMKTWIRSFSYHAGLSPVIFVAATLSALFIALVTVSLQSLKTARENPVESLKCE